MKKITALFCAVLLLLALALSGCGGEGNDPASDGQPSGSRPRRKRV